MNGVVTCTEESYFRSVCSVKCNKGYELVGPTSTRCSKSAGWEPVIGYCQSKKVDTLAVCFVNRKIVAELSTSLNFF